MADIRDELAAMLREAYSRVTDPTGVWPWQRVADAALRFLAEQPRSPEEWVTDPARMREERDHYREQVATLTAERDEALRQRDEYCDALAARPAHEPEELNRVEAVLLRHDEDTSTPSECLERIIRQRDEAERLAVASHNVAGCSVWEEGNQCSYCGLRHPKLPDGWRERLAAMRERVKP